MIKIIYILFGLLIISKAYAKNASEVFGTDRITDNLQNGGTDLVGTADNILGYLIGTLYFIAVVVGVYGGFLILVSGGDEERVKKGKNFVIYMIIGLIVIFLASIIVNWIIETMSDKNITGG